MAAQEYDRIGVGYADRRRADPRLAVAISEALADADSILNVGAGTGSYEPIGRRVVAVEPAIAMIRQRRASAAPTVRACAEALPFPDSSFSDALAVLTIHHWSDWRAGLREMVRVSYRRVVVFTWDPQSESAWLRDYFPHLIDADRCRFPTLAALRAVLGEVEISPVPIPHDCTDGFMGAYWRRPSAYLDPGVRSAISSLATGASALSLSQLADDLGTGAWERKHGQVLTHEELDLGYRLVVASVPSKDPLNLEVGEGRPPAAAFGRAHPCNGCNGQGNISGQRCPTCRGTGAERFFHGTKVDLKTGDLIKPGHRPNFGNRDRTTTYVYFTATLDAATWGAELAVGEGRGKIYIVEPTGSIEDDPNLTDKKFPGNPTKSYRSREPLRVIGEVVDWRGHDQAELKAMKDGVERAKQQGVEPID